MTFNEALDQILEAKMSELNETFNSVKVVPKNTVQ